jgi:hypothetical protein
MGSIVDFVLFPRFNVLDYTIVWLFLKVLSDTIDNNYITAITIAFMLLISEIITERWFSMRYGDDNDD